MWYCYDMLRFSSLIMTPLPDLYSKVPVLDVIKNIKELVNL